MIVQQKTVYTDDNSNLSNDYKCYNNPTNTSSHKNDVNSCIDKHSIDKWPLD